MARKVSRETARHYNWKEVCDGWHLVEHDGLSIIAERMPPNTAEDMHYHQRAAQFFYLLSGQVIMCFTDHEEHLLPGQGLEIPPMEAHQMTNPFSQDAQFIVVSSPKSHGDKIVIGS